jgi:hypothetical protein
MAVVVAMVVMTMDADADSHRADVGSDNGGVGRARAQHCEGKH